jgi:hypothetical protein
MYELIRSLTPGDFLVIKSGFELYEKETVNVSQFVAILMDILHKNQNWSNMNIEIITLIELFSYIDYQKYISLYKAKKKSSLKTLRVLLLKMKEYLQKNKI